MNSNLIQKNTIAEISAMSATNSLVAAMESWNILKQPDYTKEVNNMKFIMYKVPGLSSKNINITKQFVNKTKRTYLSITGENRYIFYTNKLDENKDYRDYTASIKTELDINTSVYNKYEYDIQDGMLIITLYEIVNKEPEFRDIKESGY